LFGVVERQELIYVQTFVTQPPVETLDVPVFQRLTWMDEIQLHARIHAHSSNALDVNSVP
jgi:hypothetical protein